MGFKMEQLINLILLMVQPIPLYVMWGTITSVLSKISIDDGSAKQPTIDFVATSHLRAMTQLASTGELVL